MTGRKKFNSKWLVAVCVTIVMCALIAGVALLLYNENMLPLADPAPTGTAGAVGEGTVHQTAQPTGEAQTGTLPGETTEPGMTQPGQPTTPGRPTNPTTPTRPTQPKPTGPVRPTTPTQPRPTQPGPTQPVATVPQQKGDSYEHWLSAGMLIGVSMQYPDFALQGIYLTGETAMADKMASGGAYILFTSGGQSMAIHSAPLAAERKTPGTTDLSTQAIGYATFDVVKPSAVNTGTLIPVEIGDLEALIAQSLLVTLYTN